MSEEKKPVLRKIVKIGIILFLVSLFALIGTVLYIKHMYKQINTVSEQ